MLKSYYCGICKSKSDQISHHKSHIHTQKHLDKKKIFSLTLDSLSKDEYNKKYKNLSKEIVIDNTETMYVFNSKYENGVYSDDIRMGDGQDSIEKLINMTNIHTDEIKMQREKINNTYNRDMLRDKIHDIHNFLRNNGAGYGMNSLKIFNIFYGLKKIELAEKNNKNTFKILEIDESCTFSYLLKLAEEGKDEILAEHINGTSEKDGMLDYMFKHENIKKLLYYDIPRHLKSSVFSHLIKEIEDLSRIEQHSNVLLSGKIYEYFVGRDEKAISELGAYFTNRLIVEFIFEKIDPTLHEDGTVPTMADIFGGSGGFTIEYIRYLQKKYPGINWETELKKVYHFDMNNDVIKSAGLEFFCLTGVIPDMNTNIKCVNSFKENFKDRRYHNVITNPPYSGDGYNKSKKVINNNKVIDYLKNEIKDLPKDNILHIQRNKQIKKLLLENAEDKKKHDENQKVSLETCNTMQEKSRIKTFAEKYNITKANDKEACSLMLIMDMVAPGGTASGVLKEGVFFNKTYQNIRRVLIENFHVRYIISVPSDQFENTSTKTSIVIFDNLGEEKPTTQVVFSELVVEKFPKDTFEEIGGEIILIESKDDIKGVKENIIATATREEILANPICSLNGKDYNKQEIVCGEEYELVNLIQIKNKKGEIIQDGQCSYLPKSKRPASFGSSEGEFNFYTSSNTIKKCVIADYKDECLIIGDGGIANIQKDINFSCSDHNHIIKSDNNNYIYYLFEGNMNLLSNGFKGSVLKNLSKTYLNSLKIPIPKTPEKLQYWVDRISAPYEAKNQKLYQQYIQELAKEAIPPELNVKQEVVVEEIKEESKEDNNDTISDTTISDTSSNTEEKDYSQYNTKELKNFCKEKGITGYSKCKKDELIQLLQNE